MKTEKRKENLKKKSKAGRKPKTLKDFDLPKNWKDIVYSMSLIGCSEVEIRAHFLMLGGKFSQPTWDALKRRNAEFLLTIQQAHVLCQAWWERAARENLNSPVFQTGSWYANMKNRFGWRDKQEIEHTADSEMITILAKYGSIDIKEFKSRINSTIGQSN